MKTTLGVCANCGKIRKRYAWSLCWTCYRSKPTRLKHKQGVADKYGAMPLATEPTKAKPGSEEKVIVMESRARDGFAIFHPLDNLAILEN